MKDWTPFCPTNQARQESPGPWTETNGCTDFAVVNDCEIQERFLFNNEADYSDQVMYQLAKTNPTDGNTLQANFVALKANGLIKTNVSPEPVDFTLAQWLAPVDPKKIATGLEWLNQWNIETSQIAGDGIKPVDVQLAVAQLDNYPPLITIDLNNSMDGLHDFHEVVLLNEKLDYFDSYSTLIKNLGDRQVWWINKLLITPKTMSNSIFVHNLSAKNADGTPNPNEFGFYHPKLSQDGCKDEALNDGLNILNADGTINFPSATPMNLG